VRVLGDRSVLNKYLNPNLLAIATTKTTGDDSVSLYLIDFVSGRLLHHAVFSQTTGPVRIVAADNDVMVSVWNSVARASQLVTMEMFEDKQKDGVLEVILG
jgi:hypothetical protein